MTTYTWTILSMDITPSLDGFSNVITNINWMFTGVNENNDSGSFSGSSLFPSPTEGTYIPYAQLTYANVCTWLETVNDMSAMYTQADIAVANVTNPTYGTDVFPWS